LKKFTSPLRWSSHRGAETMSSLYTNVVLTVIAAALVTLASQHVTGRASAAMECGHQDAPCWVVDKVALERGLCGEVSRPCFVRNLP
jgi:hypothetical protein